MPVIGAAACDDIHNAAHGPAHLSAVIRIDHAKFLHRVLRGCSSLDARSCGNVIGAVHGDEIEVDVLASKGEFRHRFDDHIGAARGRIPDLNRR